MGAWWEGNHTFAYEVRISEHFQRRVGKSMRTQILMLTLVMQTQFLVEKTAWFEIICQITGVMKSREKLN